MRRSAYIAVLLLATACNEVLMEPQKTGPISLSLSSDMEVVAVTRTDADLMDCSDFSVDIFGTTLLGQEYVSETFIYGTMPETVMLPYGTYQITAQSCLEDDAAEGLGCIRYHGVSDPVQIKSPETVPVSVSCEMANGKVTMILDESFIQDFTDIAIRLKCTREVTLSNEESLASKDVYFNVPQEGSALSYTISGTIAKGTGNERRLTYENSSSILLSPAKWAKITIRSNHNGVIGPDVDVNEEMEDDPSTEIINPEDGVPVTDGMQVPSIIVDTEIDDATVVDCVIDIYNE